MTGSPTQSDRQVSISTMSLGTLYESILDFSSKDNHEAFWRSVCKNARWIFPSNRMCVLTRAGDQLVLVAGFERGKMSTHDAATSASGGLGKLLIGQATHWIDDPAATFSDEGDAVAAWFRTRLPATVLSLAVEVDRKNHGALCFCMGEVTAKDRTMLTALGTVYALHVGMAETVIRMKEERRENERRLVEAEKMAALGGLVAGIAHEINTPVGIGVTASTHLHAKLDELVALYKAGTMKRSHLNKFLETASQSSQLILSNLNRAAELISSFKKVAVDQSSEGRRKFGLNEYIHEVLVSLRPKIKKTTHEVIIDCDAEIEIDGYPGALAQIVTNLVVNSLIHAFAPNEAGTLRFDVSAAGKNVVIAYSDDGRGIADEELAQVFDPFFTTRRAEGGSGLGLHIVYNLATQKLNGRVDVVSEVGKGTTFTLIIPKVQPEAKP